MWGEGKGKEPHPPTDTGFSQWVSKENSQTYFTPWQGLSLTWQGPVGQGQCISRSMQRKTRRGVRVHKPTAPLKGLRLPRASRSAPRLAGRRPGDVRERPGRSRQAACACQAPKVGAFLKSFPLEVEVLMHGARPSSDFHLQTSGRISPTYPW